MRKGIAAIAVLLSSLVPHPARGSDAVTPGELVVEPPTLHSLGFEWSIGGDENRNAAVSVQYRPRGQAEWRQALPLLRIGGERIASDNYHNMRLTEPMFAGSIFDLEPGTEVEVRLSLTDPDGGSVARELTARTKPMPQAFAGGATLHVRPGESPDPAAGPAFTGLQAALDKANPGDRILVHAGAYTGHYRAPRGGAADKPIVIQGAGDGEAVLVNDGHPQMFDIHKADYLWFEGLTFRDPGTGDGGQTVGGVVLLAGNAGHGFSPGCKGLVVRHCLFEDIGVGVMAADPACEGFVITDNRFHGRQNWTGPKDDPTGACTGHSYVAVWVGGAGHDVGYNFVRGFRDGINVCGEYGKDKPVSIDFYNNDITQVGDDFMETEPGWHNIRVYRNRLVNSQTCGISAQPVYGGPVYIFRNALYNAPRGVPLKFNGQPAGLLAYHNTFVSAWKNWATWSNGHFRNNLFMGPIEACTFTDYSSMDHDAFAPGPIVFGMPRTGWKNEAEGQLERCTYADLKAFSEATGLERHGITAGYDVFEDLQPPEGLGRTYDPASLRFSLRPNGAAVDAGEVLPNINDGFAGRAPDLGALERGQPIPHYGPRQKN